MTIAGSAVDQSSLALFDAYLANVPRVRLERLSATVLQLSAIGPPFIADAMLGDLAWNPYSVDATTAFELDADGTHDSGRPIAASTFYYVYAVNGGVFDHKLGLSAQAPGSSNTGAYWLDTALNGVIARLVGWCYTSAAVQFTDTDAARHVISYFGRRKKLLFSCPGYADGNTKTTLAALNNAVFGPINGGAGDKVSYIANGEDAIELAAVFTINAALTAVCLVGVSEEAFGAGATSPAVVGSIGNLALAASSVAVAHVDAPAAVGHRQADLVAMTNAANVVFVADQARTGAAADPAATYIVGSVWG